LCLQLELGLQQEWTRSSRQFDVAALCSFVRWSSLANEQSKEKCQKGQNAPWRRLNASRRGIRTYPHEKLEENQIPI